MKSLVIGYEYKPESDNTLEMYGVDSIQMMKFIDKISALVVVNQMSESDAFREALEQDANGGGMIMSLATMGLKITVRNVVDKIMEVG